MPIYTYKGYDAVSGANRKGKIEADSPKSARSRLRLKEKIIVSDIKEETNLANAKKVPSFRIGSGVSLSDMAI